MVTIVAYKLTNNVIFVEQLVLGNVVRRTHKKMPPLPGDTIFAKAPSTVRCTVEEVDRPLRKPAVRGRFYTWQAAFNSDDGVTHLLVIGQCYASGVPVLRPRSTRDQLKYKHSKTALSHGNLPLRPGHTAFH